MEEFTLKDSKVIKGIAIMLMIFHHLFWMTSFTKGYSISFFPLTVGRIAQIAAFSKICVSLFVFISGFGLLHSYKGLKKKNNFLLIRFFKLIPTFIIITLISYILFFIFEPDFIKTSFFNNDIYSGIFYILFDILGLSTILKTPTICGEWWYIGATFIFAFLVPIIYNLSKKYGWFIVGLGIILIPRLINITQLSSLIALPYVFILFLGMYCEETNLITKIVNKRIINSDVGNKLLKLIIYFGIFLISFLYFSHISWLIFMELSFGLIPFVVILFICEFIIPCKPLASILAFVGEQSAIMYMIHAVFLRLFKGYLYSQPHFLLAFGNLFIGSLLFAIVLNFILKKTEYYNLFDKIINKYKKV